MLLFTYFIYPFITKAAIPPFSQQIYDYAFLQDFAKTFNWAHVSPGGFWSLAVEEHFYLFWPLLVYWLPKKHLSKALIAIVLLSMATRYILTVHHFEVFYFTFSRLDELALGSLMAVYNFDAPNKRRARWCFVVFWLGIIPTVMLFILFSGESLPLLQIVKYTPIAFAYSALIGYVMSISEHHSLKEMLKSRFLRYTGKVSFGLYVYHPACFFIFNKYFSVGVNLLDFVLSFVFTYLIASLSYHYFEAYFLRFKDRFAYTQN